MAMPAAWVTLGIIIYSIGNKNLRLRLIFRYTPRYLLNSLFSMASKNLRYRSIACNVLSLLAARTFA
jgi:hypothetical protein